mmetsp:Transcript_28057/g.57486  ORF Transcript_28057/g.57486 Transcript_28057/m.57486 type:complete len:639 (-) Transcript_28057:198-2114(-)|eukprot:CAMPEP_0181296196 /NCGR_PEP_ID=MMETSP1101-20121128/4567_1 /TAXON_ID=46948 /ORGANISM="Rhodomonas abbreviata, Strain Caron Lab Isolate" /LENGTH=638 /DNA_ID=CAMNT_0023401029 /DNA_START=198 /DNA_END=2114 /DNA_ORIENTATION=-
MFWRLGFAQTSPVEQLLENADVTLQELMDEEELMQECKQLNKKLIDFLSVHEQIDRMLSYVVEEPPEDADDKTRYLYPYKASEVLAADLAPVYDTLFASESLTDKLFSFLDKEEGQLNVLLAGFFSKIVSSLLTGRPQQTLQILDKRQSMWKLMDHIGTQSILELLLKVVSEAQEAVQDGPWVRWLLDMDLVGQLVAKLDTAQSSDVHENAATALVGLLTRNTMASQWGGGPPACPPHFAKQLLRPQTVEDLMMRTLKGSPSSLEHGLTVVVELAQHCVRVAHDQGDSFSVAPSACSVRGARSFSFEDDLEPAPEPVIDIDLDVEGMKKESVPQAVQGVLAQVEGLVEVLRKPPPIPPIVNSAGTLDPPLGSTRLKVLEVLQALVGLDYQSVDEALCSLKALPAALDLFFRYEWHNMMHNLVQRMLETILQKETDYGLKASVVEEGRLMERIVEALDANDEWVQQPKRCRQGHMGHLRMLCSALMRASQTCPYIREHTQSPLWTAFLAARPDLLSDLNDKSFSRSADVGHMSPLAPAPSTGDFMSSMDQDDDDVLIAEAVTDLEAPSNVPPQEGPEDPDEIMAEPIDKGVDALTAGMMKLQVSPAQGAPRRPIAKVKVSVEMVGGKPTTRVTVTALCA